MTGHTHAIHTGFMFSDEPPNRWQRATGALASHEALLRALVVTAVLAVGSLILLAAFRLEQRVRFVEFAIAAVGALLGIGLTVSQHTLGRRVAAIVRPPRWGVMAGPLFLLGALAAASFGLLSSGVANHLVPAVTPETVRPAFLLAGAHLAFLFGMVASLGAPRGLAVTIGAERPKLHVRGAAWVFGCAIAVAAGGYALYFVARAGQAAAFGASVLSMLLALVAVSRSLGASRHLRRTIELAEE